MPSSAIPANVEAESPTKLDEDGLPQAPEGQQKQSNISEEKVIEVFNLLENKSIAKEALENIFTLLANEERLKVNEVIEKLNLKKINKQQLEKIIDEIIQDKKELIIEKRENAFKIIMGIVMQRVRGKIDGKEVSEIIKEKMRNIK